MCKKRISNVERLFVVKLLHLNIDRSLLVYIRQRAAVNGVILCVIIVAINNRVNIMTNDKQTLSRINYM